MNNPYFGGLGGKISKTISFITKHWSEETDVMDSADGCFFEFLDNYYSNHKSITRKNVAMHFNVFSMMAGRKCVREVKEKFKLAQKNDDWENILKVAERCEDPFDLEKLKKMASVMD
ncbi:hypothetical protein FNH22_23775 [Fulvivirga sp. M361]|uniref:hypothetical protein n=1 Tax=Fulvivirga sp. M361 TaxID=2594266 RepID=UPI00117BA005|nr:hypothetical protein [Fulvivirga sp. M361]TRX51587.1 hypothetical protein FNH22_23775 [Fulvivirga sp. M361]